jgi:hypothetical protein
MCAVDSVKNSLEVVTRVIIKTQNVDDSLRNYTRYKVSAQFKRIAVSESDADKTITTAASRCDLACIYRSI